MVLPSVARIERNSRWTSDRVIGSSAPKGSSINKIGGVGGEGASNADALALAAGKLIGKAFSDGRGVKADFLEQLDGAGSLFAFGTTLKGRGPGLRFRRR